MYGAHCDNTSPAADQSLTTDTNNAGVSLMCVHTAVFYILNV